MMDVPKFIKCKNHGKNLFTVIISKSNAFDIENRNKCDVKGMWCAPICECRTPSRDLGFYVVRLQHD